MTILIALIAGAVFVAWIIYELRNPIDLDEKIDAEHQEAVDARKSRQKRNA